MGYKEREIGFLVERVTVTEGSRRSVACLTRRVRLRGSSWFCPERWRRDCGLRAVCIKM